MVDLKGFNNWLTDKVRFSFDSFETQRVHHVFLRDFLSDNFSIISWSKALNILKTKVLVNYSFLNFFYGLGSSFELLSFNKYCFPTSINLLNAKEEALSSINQVSKFINNFLFSFKGFFDSNVFFVFGTNSRFELPSIYLNLKQKIRSGCKVFSLSASNGFFNFSKFKFLKNLSNFDINLGFEFSKIFRFLKGNLKICQYMYKSELASIMMPMNFFSIFKSVLNFFPSEKVLLVPSESSYLTFLDINISNPFFSSFSTSYFYSNFSFMSDNIFFKPSKNFLSVYVGYVGESFARNADLVLPIKHPYEDLSNCSILDLSGFYKTVSNSKILLKENKDQYLDLKDLRDCFSILFKSKDFLNHSNSLEFKFFSLKEYKFRFFFYNCNLGFTNLLFKKFLMNPSPLALNILDRVFLSFKSFGIFNNKIDIFCKNTKTMFLYFRSESFYRLSYNLSVACSRFRSKTLFNLKT